MNRILLIIITTLFFSFPAINASDYPPGLDTLSPDKSAAMRFLYDNLPLRDRTAHSPEFYLKNVEASIKAKKEMPWGNKVPEREWLHFVLPVRVNNENLDLSRPAFYEELSRRVKNLSMEEAILEVNHWCHEKVTYRPSDGRTSPPLSTVSQAIGRCGEESTFTVAALRAVGIPARQIYTPRWAHTDDNHAWVEAWAGGKWHFIGACEPAPRLDMAWFNAPAARGLMMSTNVFGKYDGPEEVLTSNPLITTINVTSNYAPTEIIRAKVVDSEGNPVEGAKVNFCIYNYAEFYPAVSKTTDINGKAETRTGLGDMAIWATDGNKFGFAFGRAGGNEIILRLDKDKNFSGQFTADIVPPGAAASLPEVSPEEEDANAMRLMREDSIRNAYTSSFFTAEKAGSLAHELSLPADKIVKILTEARGNGNNIAEFIKGKTHDRRIKAIDLLLSVTEKDRRDIPLPVLDDNLENTPTVSVSAELYDRYVLSPRIENEALVPFKAFFQAEIHPDSVKEYRKNPGLLADWTARNIIIDDASNPQKLRMDPRTVWQSARGDAISRNIMFVACARSLGIPSRIDPVTSKTQYIDADGQWIDVDFGNRATSEPRVGDLMINFTPAGHIDDPRYYSQFSICRISEGIPVQLEYDENITLSALAPDGILRLDAGQYMLLSGQRLADGSVLAKGTIFNIVPDSTTVVDLEIRRDEEALQVIGSLNAENVYHDYSGNIDKSILSTTGRGYYVLAIIAPGTEPTSHFLNDLCAAKDDLEKSDAKILVLFQSMEDLQRFDGSAFPQLPANVVFGIDKDGTSQSELIESLHLNPAILPVVVIADTFNRVVFSSQGYSIGLGSRLNAALKSLNE